jgi:hypothetical protein
LIQDAVATISSLMSSGTTFVNRDWISGGLDTIQSLASLQSIGVFRVGG